MDAEKCLNKLPEKYFQTVYIDPPYNTQSKKFEYHDDYADWDVFIASKIRIKCYKKQAYYLFLLTIIN